MLIPLFGGGQWVEEVPIEGLVVADRPSGGGGDGVGKTEDGDHGRELRVAVQCAEGGYAGAVPVRRHLDLVEVGEGNSEGWGEG